MSLFVGNVSKNVNQREFEEEFKSFGSCRVDLRKGFAFVQYDNERNAEQAKKELQHKNFCGLRFNIEWSKNSGRFNQNTKAHHNNSNGHRSGMGKRSRSRDRSRRKNEQRWFRRSPSHDRRSSPSYSDHDLDTFEPRCPRDNILLDILKQKRQEKRLIELERQRQAQIDGEILNDNEIVQPKKEIQTKKGANQGMEMEVQQGEQMSKQNN